MMIRIQVKSEYGKHKTYTLGVHSLMGKTSKKAVIIYHDKYFDRVNTGICSLFFENHVSILGRNLSKNVPI